mgnify:CR=1 FL=1
MKDIGLVWKTFENTVAKGSQTERLKETLEEMKEQWSLNEDGMLELASEMNHWLNACEEQNKKKRRVEKELRQPIKWINEWWQR